MEAQEFLTCVAEETQIAGVRRSWMGSAQNGSSGRMCCTPPERCSCLSRLILQGTAWRGWRDTSNPLHPCTSSDPASSSSAVLSLSISSCWVPPQPWLMEEELLLNYSSAANPKFRCSAFGALPALWLPRGLGLASQRWQMPKKGRAHGILVPQG